MTVFSALLALGSILGLSWIILEVSPSARRITLMAGTTVLFGALVGGRVAYIALHWIYFQDHIVEVPQVWLGGLAWPGALIGGILSTIIAAWFSKIPVLALADRLLPLLMSLSVSVWLGCWLSGCAYGPEIDWGLPAQDEWGIWKKRLPLQLIAASIFLFVLWGVDRYRKGSLPPGLRASFGLLVFSLVMLGASFLRTDPYPQYYGLRLETWSALIFVGLALSITLKIVFFHADKSK